MAAADAPRADVQADADPSAKKDRFGALKPFVIVSSSYLLFTITDGAIRMVVLLFAYQHGFSAFDVAIMCAPCSFNNVLSPLSVARWFALLINICQERQRRAKRCRLPD